MSQIRDKIKGILLVILSMPWVFFIYNFDDFVDKRRGLGTKEIFAYILGIVIFINGIRIYRRK
jgi:hypothetical protein